MKLTRRTTLSAISLSIALTLGATPLAFGADSKYPPGVDSTQPPVIKDAVKVIATPVKSGAVVIVAPSKPTQENLDGLKDNKAKSPVALSDKAMLGGTNNVKNPATVSVAPTKGKASEVQTFGGTPTNVTVGGFRPAKAGYQISIYVWVTGNDEGRKDLGNYYADNDGNLTLPSVTLEAGASATFVLVEEVPGKFTVPPAKSPITFNGKKYSFDTPGPIMEKRVLLSVRAKAVASFSTTQVKRK